ncbi:MAG: hypothetical protein EBR28_06585 [Planctomycetia bacterium]|nr:hypothetical protein [Planctomycetia bacterium]
MRAFAVLCCILAAGRSAEGAEEIVPIQFADRVGREAEEADVLAIPSVLAAEEPVPGTERIISDRAASEPPSVETEVEVPAEAILATSSRAADAMRLDELTLDEMPFEASSGDWFSNGRWYGSAEMLWFDRSRNYRRLLGYDVTKPGPSGTNRLPVGSFTTTGIPFPLAPGARITLGEYLGRDYLDRDRSLEMTYYGGLSFYQQDQYNAIPGSFLVTPLTVKVPGFSGAQTFNTTHNSIYNSLEWNYKLHRRLGRDQLVMSPNGKWSRHAERAWLPAFIIGTRVTNVNESFTFASRRNDVDASQFGGNYAINTQNWLWGMNFGGELISQNEFYFWGLRGRVTPSMSFTGNQQAVNGVDTLTTLPNPAPPPATIDNPFAQGSFSRTSSYQQLVPGFVGDLSLFAGWNVTPNFIVKAGYDFLWVAGIATATRQFNLDNVRQNAHDGGGQIFYNGLSFGCEGSW